MTTRSKASDSRTPKSGGPKSGGLKSGGLDGGDEDLLEMVQRQTFRFFWEGAHPVSGLAREPGEGSGFRLVPLTRLSRFARQPPSPARGEG